jgi:hypothetical protein
MPVSGESRILRLVFYQIQIKGRPKTPMVKGKCLFSRYRLKKIQQDYYEKYSLVMHVKHKSTIFEPNIMESKRKLKLNPNNCITIKG